MGTALFIGLVVAGVGYVAYRIMSDHNVGPFNNNEPTGGRVIDGPDDNDNDPFARPE